MGIYQVEYCLGGNYIRRNFLDWNNPGGNFLGDYYSGGDGGFWVAKARVGVILGGNFTGGNCPGRSYPG